MAIKIQGTTVIDDSRNIIDVPEATFTGTSAIQIPVGTSTQRPSGAKGKIRFNDETKLYEGYDGSAWSSLGGAQAAGVIWENSTVIYDNYTLTSGKNGFSVGPITIDNGISVTVPAGQCWVVI